jgi:protein SCO1
MMSCDGGNNEPIGFHYYNEGMGSSMRRFARTFTPAGEQSVFRLVLFALVCAISFITLSGCRGRQANPGSGEATLTGNIQTYQVKGTIVGADSSTGEVTIDSEPIAGFMSAMVMPYQLAQPNIASELHRGDRITARLRVTDIRSLLDQIVVVAQQQPDYKPVVLYNVPTAGQPVPDFRFVNQDGKAIEIDRFRGKALLVTFIYTRCPLPDFCPRMSRNFAEIDRALAADPHLYAQTHLLSVSFDPGYDTPKVLRSYGVAYIGKDSNIGKDSRESFAHWDFAAPSQADLEKVDEFFDVGVTPGENQTLTHSLSTVLIAPDGKIARWYPTNDWKPAALVDDVKRVLAQSAHPAAHATPLS